MADANNYSMLNHSDIELLNFLLKRREIFDAYIDKNKLNLFTCPGCGYPTNSTRAEYDICVICDWEDDGYDDNSKSIFDDFLVKNKISGPNRISLIDNRLVISRLLFEIAKKENGQIVDDPKLVLVILEKNRMILRRIYKSIPGTADKSHVGWKEAAGIKLKILDELVARN